MKRLLLDIGNSAFKWALADGRQLLRQGRFPHRDADVQRCADLEWGNLEAPDEVVAANVAGAAMAVALTDWCERHWGMLPRFPVSGRTAGGVTNGYRVPETLGIDRWAALVGARAVQEGAVCVVDCGTAITLDLLDASGLHRGGLIIAGIETMQQALQRNTVNLVAPIEQTAVAPLADNTADAIVSGSVYAAAAAIGRVVTEMAAHCGGNVSVLLTGGDAQRVMPLLRVQVLAQPDLVLAGLAILAGEQ